MATQGAITGHEDPSSVIVLVEGGQLLLYDLTATTGRQAASRSSSPTPGAKILTEQRSGSPSKHRSTAAPQQEQKQQQQQQQDSGPPPPVVQQLFKGQLQGKPLVTAARLRMIPIQPVPLCGLQVCVGCISKQLMQAENRLGCNSRFPLYCVCMCAACWCHSIGRADPCLCVVEALCRLRSVLHPARLAACLVHASDCAPLLVCRHCALQGASMSGLREWAVSSKQSQQATADKQSWAWVVQGGCAALPATHGMPQHSAPRVHAGNKTSSSSSSYATLYCTGHSDGAVRLWDMHGQVPQLLGSVPSSAAAHALSSIRKTRAAAVCTLEFAWEQGLLISGHEGGEVRHMRTHASVGWGTSIHTSMASSSFWLG